MSSYANSEAGKSDIATVCSESVTEDIEISSVDMTLSHALISVLPSPTSDRGVLMPGSLFRRSVEFDPSSFTTPAQKHAAKVYATASDKAAPTSPMTLMNHNSDQSSSVAATQRWNDMGPPLSRALLMQSLHGGTGIGNAAGGSRAGSVKSYGSNAGASQNSDLVAHVDTDDCGGSLMESVTDGQSVHSQEDVRSQNEVDNPYNDRPPGPISTDDDGSDQNNNCGGDHSEDGRTHPFLKNGSSGEHTNGRTSPGGTIYKGKGVRRYQGRYMNLPLQRFRQDNADDDDLLDTVLEADKVMKEQSHQQRNGRGYGYEDHWRRSESPPIIRSGQHDDRYGRPRGRSPSRTNAYHDNNNNNNNSSNRRGAAGYQYHKPYHHRSRSRSISPDKRRSTRRKRWNRPSSPSSRDTHWGSGSANNRRHYHPPPHLHPNNRNHSGGSQSPPHSPNNTTETTRRSRKRSTSRSCGRT